MTREKWAAMSADERWVKLAELCGYTNVSQAVPEDRFGEGHEPPMVGHRPESKSRGLRHPVPDYLNDLNAMHEAEKLLFGHDNDNETWANYEVHLRRVKGGPKWLLIRATAAQRAEALALTLEPEG